MAFDVGLVSASHWSVSWQIDRDVGETRDNNSSITQMSGATPDLVRQYQVAADVLLCPFSSVWIFWPIVRSTYTY